MNDSATSAPPAAPVLIVSKRALPPSRMIQEKVRITVNQSKLIALYLTDHEGKKRADAWRDVINAGFKALGLTARARAADAGSICAGTVVRPAAAA